jgi:predicted AAA+ superfamily ATPase
MFARSMQQQLLHLMQQYPVVTVLGPRQSGKTTLVRLSCPGKAYYNLENQDTLALIMADPKQFFAGIDLSAGVIFDEIQSYPQLLSYIQVVVDEKRVAGSFILTGSHQLYLTAAISQSLAGRTALLELLPLSISELNNASVESSVDQYLLKGFYPANYHYDLDPTVASRNYIKTYVERDVRQIKNIQNLASFQRFIKLCAGRVGSTINYESISSDVGISQTTVKNWLSLLEASYLTFQLQPYFENLGKRIIKAPKLYFLDVGVASYLLDIKSLDQVSHDRLRGGLFENLVIVDMLKYLYNNGMDNNLYFFRDSHQNEVDLIMQINDKLIPVEIKVTSTFNGSLLKGIKKFRAIVNNRVPISFLIYSGEEAIVDDIHLINCKNITKVFHFS